MTRILIFAVCIFLLAVPVSALEFAAPEVPPEGRSRMPDHTESFADGLWELIGEGIAAAVPCIREAVSGCTALTAAVLLLSLVETVSPAVKTTARFLGAAAVTMLLLENTNSMITLGAETVTRISDYGKLLLGVLTAALAAQGGITASAALYAGTAVFDALLTGLIRSVLLPGLWLYLTVSIGYCASEQSLLKRMGDWIKSTVSWVLKTSLMVFTSYLGITGVVSGTTDAAALKAAKVTISSFVPVVGGILSEASEAVLTSAAVMKNAAGIYGILAVLALFLDPFLRIGAQYLVLKLTAAVCEVVGGKAITELISSFSSAMGLLLAMTGCCCVLVLISTVCYLRGVGA